MKNVFNSKTFTRMESKLRDTKDSDKEYRCGIGPFHPPCLQRLVGVRSFITVIGSLKLMSWSLYTVTVSQITNIEKAFGLTSAESGWLMTIWELGYLISTLVASYFGSRAHMPLVMGCACIVFGISGLVAVLPHFFAYTDSQDRTDLKTNFNMTFNPNLCHNITDADSYFHQSTASPEEAPIAAQKTLAYVLLIMGMILQGVGIGPCFPYYSKYIDDSVDKQNTGYYLGNNTQFLEYIYQIIKTKLLFLIQLPTQN